MARVLAGRQLLLVLDNCEHVIGAAAEHRGAAMSPVTAAEYALMLTAPDSAQAPPPGPAKLSAREQELITLVAQGHTNAQIAASCTSASTSRFPARISAVKHSIPASSARSLSRASSAEATPRSCQASTTVTATSAVSGRSAWRMNWHPPMFSKDSSGHGDQHLAVLVVDLGQFHQDRLGKLGHGGEERPVA